MVLMNALQKVGVMSSAALNLPAEQTQNPPEICFFLIFKNGLTYFCKCLPVSYSFILI